MCDESFKYKPWLFQKALDMVTGVENILKEHAGTKELLPSQKRRLRELQLPNGRYRDDQI